MNDWRDDLSIPLLLGQLALVGLMALLMIYWRVLLAIPWLLREALEARRCRSP